MTEQEWLACDNPGAMLNFYARSAGNRSVRLIRLFGCACARRVWELLDPEHRHKWMEFAERLADGLESDDDVAAVDARITHELPSFFDQDDARGARLYAALTLHHALVGPALVMPERAGYALWHAAGRDDAITERERAFHLHLVRELIPNPFRTLAADPAWRAWQGGTIQHLAQAAYDERVSPSGHLDPARLGVLADALEEAGCDEAEMISHLRSPGPHVRGCWAVDLLLGKRDVTEELPPLYGECPIHQRRISQVAEIRSGDQPVRFLWCPPCSVVFACVGEPPRVAAEFELDDRLDRWVVRWTRSEYPEDVQHATAAIAQLRPPPGSFLLLPTPSFGDRRYAVIEPWRRKICRWLRL